MAQRGKGSRPKTTRKTVRRRRKPSWLARIDWRRWALGLGVLLLAGTAAWGTVRWVQSNTERALRAASVARATPLPTLRAPAPPRAPATSVATTETRPGAAGAGSSGDAVAVHEPAPAPAPVKVEPKPVLPADTAGPRGQVASIAPDAGKQEAGKQKDSAVPRRPTIAIIIDDVGLNTSSARRAIRLPASVTLAFLPYGDETPKLAGEARAAGHEVFVHLQMAPEGKADPGPHALVEGLDDHELRARTDWALSRVAGAVGANNHMGSRMTADAHAMRVVLAELDRHQMAFIDSRTSAQSVAEATARQMGVPTSRRDVFLDNEQDASAIDTQLAATVRLARRTGTAVAIGHPHPSTLAALERWIAQMREEGVNFVSATDLIDIRRCGAAGAGEAAAACLQADLVAASPG